ncbi:caffeic acid 3-O-methyltransferase 1-like [Macadamia integrifolia]|uniref:caffeic acid 3-O-methyltransferase 1-like n=1 Tax=Macadamia integrifolia TaxID=60698 RepID=UPI001C50250C|nr:caffeic acid 3-O-methyltransferase 1-like [Macadamia integrifolia]
MEEEEESQFLAMQMVSASVLPMALRAALELHVFDIIAEAGPRACLSPQDIASRLLTHNPDAPGLLDRMLRLLVSHSLLTCSVLSHDHRVYGLAPASKLFVKNKDGASLAPYLLIIQDYSIVNTWCGTYRRRYVYEYSSGECNFHEDYGKVIVVELIAPTSPETNVATKGNLQNEMFMTNINHNGKERTKEEFTTLAREAGFSGINVACSTYTFSVIEFYK